MRILLPFKVIKNTVFYNCNKIVIFNTEIHGYLIILKNIILSLLSHLSEYSTGETVNIYSSVY